MSYEDKVLSHDFSSAPAEPLPYDHGQLSSPVALSAWRHQSSPVIIVLVVLILEAAGVGAAAYLILHPYKLPLGRDVASHLSVRSFNVIINILASVMAALAASVVSYGCRSHLSKKLVREGVTLREYERWFAIGNAGTVKRVSLTAILPALVLAVASLSAAGYTGIFSAATGSFTSRDLRIPYPDFLSNTQIIASGEAATFPLLSAADFDGWVNSFREALEEQPVSSDFDIQGVTSLVDGIRSGVGVGIVPSLLQVSTLTARLNNATGPGARMTAAERSIVSHGSGNSFRASVPVVVSNTNCGPSNMTFGTPSASDGIFKVTISDPICGSSVHSFELTDEVFVGAVMCMNQDGFAHSTYYQVQPNVNKCIALPACKSSVYAGIASNVTYLDSQLDYAQPAYNLTSSGPVFADDTTNTAFRDSLKGVTNVTQLAVDIINWNWVRNFGAHGSQSLSVLLGLADDQAAAGARNFTTDQIGAAVVILTRGLLAVGVAKLLNTAGVLHSNNLLPEIGTTELETVVTAQCVQIGPSARNAAYIAPLIATFIISSIAFFFTCQFRPTTVNPLDSISMMLVAQNSAVTPLADGGCLGEPANVRSPGAAIKLRAINAQHLAFVWGDNHYEPPVIGRMYGCSGDMEPKRMD